MEEFYFWTRPELVLNPFDVVKVEHINNSKTYGVVEEISHITDSASFLADYISNDFGDIHTAPITHRIGMNYVKAKIVGNTENIYIPVLNGKSVAIAEKEEVSAALGLSTIKHPIPCGYLEMYQGAGEEDRVRLTVNMDSKYLIGPEGAHLNISGISGLAAKTSYAMFLLKGIQDKCLNALKSGDKEADEDVAFVIFNVKGKDLLAIDEPNVFDSEKEREEVLALYDELGLSKTPFKNVHYYYPYSDTRIHNTYLEKENVTKNIDNGKAHMFKYEHRHDKENLDLMFSSIDDPGQTMDSILNYIISGRGEFGNLDSWNDFLDKVKKCGEAGGHGDKEISVLSWRKFERIVKKSIYNNPLFGSIKATDKEIRISQALADIKKNEVHVIDIAKLSDDMQAFVFGDAIKAIYNLKLSPDDEANPPSKIVIFIDELNKYASSDVPKSSPILRQVLDIAERGRSLGIVLFGAEQFKSAIHQRVTGNCSTFAYGRTNAIELTKSDYRFIPSIYKSMMSRLKQGEYIIQNPVFRSLLNIMFPKPIYKQFKSK